MALKIGILTLPIIDNYGGILQAVALYRLLYEQGHKVILIYQAPEAASQNLLYKLLKKILLKIPFHNFKNIKANQKLVLERAKIIKEFRSFIEQEIYIISKNLYTKKDLEDFSKQEKFDAVIVGSDQVWRKGYIKNSYYKSYFLEFVDSSKTNKIAYAASFGKDHWEGENDIEDIAKLLQDFKAVSVREASGIDICKKTFDYDNAVHVLDPTMLIGKEFYLNEIIAKYDVSNISESGLVTYVLDEAKEKREIIEFVQKNTELESVFHLKGFNTSYTTYSVPQWLASIAYADFVVTDSFHGMVFAILFEKDFLVIGNRNRGLDRFISLISLLGLESKLVFGVEDLKNKKFDSIDYIRVNEILNNEKKKSLQFLMGALNGN